ncbi:MAG: hypothetical protein U5N86_10495 [Planctomycetota bacterium]|nr:hypothetical protein [Planctomycetota bacterium]
MPSDFDANRLDKTDLPPRSSKEFTWQQNNRVRAAQIRPKVRTADHITAANGSPYTYDNNGNLLTKGSETFTYDWKNNLVRYQNTSTVEDVWLGYDIGNTLVAKGWTEEGGVWMEDLGENPEPDKYPDSFSIEEGGSLDELCEKIQAHKDGKE